MASRRASIALAVLGVESRESRHCQRDRRGVATGVRLNHEMVRPKVGQLLVDEGSVFRWRDDEDPLAGNELRDAIHGVLQEACLAQQLEELLRPVTPREWPE